MQMTNYQVSDRNVQTFIVPAMYTVLCYKIQKFVDWEGREENV